MSEFQKHLYLILYPNEALVASELTPEAFGKHYSVGSPRHFSGKVIFAEIDTAYRNEYLKIDEVLKHTTTGKPGVAKRTKFVKSYRVMEHIDISAFRDLYLVTVDGHVLGLQKSDDFQHFQQPARVRVYQEICPLRLLVASNLDPLKFGPYITEESWSKGAPKVLFTQFDLDIEDYVKNPEVAGYGGSPIHNVNPNALVNAVRELDADPNKKTKTISLNPSLDDTPYRMIKYGFWLAAGSKVLYYPIPSLAELQEKHYRFWRQL